MVKTVTEFKELFAPVKKKPKPPSKVLAKHKAALEKNIENEEWDIFSKDLEKLYNIDQNGSKQYALDLMAYKIAKHIDDDKGEAWVRKTGTGMLNDVAQRIIPNDLSDEATVRQFRKAQKSGNGLMQALFQARDNAGVMRLFQEDSAGAISKKIEAGFQSDDRDTLTEQGSHFEAVVKHGDPVALARKNPKLFFEVVLKGFKESHTANFSRVFEDRELRLKLKAACPKEWSELAAETPMLAVLDDVEAKMAAKQNKDRKEPSKEDRVSAVFDAILDPNLMKCSYIASSLFYNASDIMSGQTERNTAVLDNVKAVTGGMPATDCHNLLHLSRRLVGAALGEKQSDDAEMVTGEDGKRRPKNKAAGMVVTKPLKDIKAQGLIGSFGGNVFTEDGKATGQVFFTGDDKGEDSHSWLIIKVEENGKQKEIEFDPVLGTRGAAVRAAVAEQGIKWFNKKSGVAEMKGGWFLVLNKDKDAGANNVGITSNYTLTQTKPASVEREEVE